MSRPAGLAARRAVASTTIAATIRCRRAEPCDRTPPAWRSGCSGKRQKRRLVLRDFVRSCRNAAAACRLCGIAGGVGTGDDLVHLAAASPDRREPDAGADRMRAAVPAEVQTADSVDDGARRD